MVHVLVVDDDPDVRTTVRLILEDEGYTVTLAENGIDGFARIQQQRPDLILLDLLMPMMNGWEFLRRLRDEGERTPVIFFTAGHPIQPVDVQQPDATLEKPFSIDDLVTAVRQFVPGS